jgi:hypothetical protein
MKTIWMTLLGTAVLTGTLAAPAFANPGNTAKSGVDFYGGKPGGFAPGPAPALPAPSNNSAFANPVNSGKSGVDFDGGKPSGSTTPGPALPSALSPTNINKPSK